MNMVGLADIGPAIRIVEVRGKPVEVKGISAQDIVALLQEFPEFKAMLGDRNPNIDLSAARLIELVPDAVAAIIAYGISGGDEMIAKTRVQASFLVLEEQADLLEAIVALTLPKGVGPFVERLGKLGLFGEDASGKVPATKSPQPSKASSQTGTE